MKIEHIAIWVQDLERMKTFYETYFKGKAGAKYHNPKKNFTSYFITFEEGCRLEIMHKPDIPNTEFAAGQEHLGLIHFAISVGDKEAVNALTNQLRKDGYIIAREPCTMGDGYYESVAFDPENNRTEITI